MARINQIIDYTDILILGHTHRPMHVRTGALQVLNAGSVYGVTARDSHTCATLTLPARDFRVFDLRSGELCARASLRTCP